MYMKTLFRLLLIPGGYLIGSAFGTFFSVSVFGFEHNSTANRALTEGIATSCLILGFAISLWLGRRSR